MFQFQRIFEFFHIPEGRPELVAAQLQALSTKVPLMYAFIILNVIGLAYTHYPYAPLWMSVVMPGMLVAISLVRLVKYRSVRGQVLGEQETRSRLRMTAILSLMLSVVFVIWTLALTQYGTAYTRTHVICFAVVTVLGNAACLMHVRAAVVAMLAGVIAPLTVFLVLSGNVVFMVMAVNVIAVAIAIMLVLFTSYSDFEKLVTSRTELERERESANELSRINLELATIDSLTGLRNRRGFFTAFEQLLQDNAAQGRLAVGVLDLDGFKQINDIYGHAAGDQILREVGRRLVALGPDVTVGRLGGDEFGLVFTGFSDADELVARGEMVCERMGVPFRMDSAGAQMSGSIGIAVATDTSCESRELLKRADHALYHAKQHAAGSAVLFTEALAARIRESLGIERRLRDANFDKEMRLDYQFIYDTASDAIVGAEALARWTSPAIGPVPPEAFIPAAERAGLIGQLTEVLFKKLLDEFSDWPERIFVSFNLSAYDICAPERILGLISMADRRGIDAKRLTFEITETAVMYDFERAQESLRLLKHFGARIALDDFGTGQSSLSYVHTLPLDRVKVDRSFIAEIESRPATRAVVKTIIDLCTHLDLDCIIEGVETRGQFELMRELGCTTFQGFLFSRPLDGVAARRFIVASAGDTEPAQQRAS